MAVPDGGAFRCPFALPATFGVDSQPLAGARGNDRPSYRLPSSVPSALTIFSRRMKKFPFFV
jgi:hypothetical protein